MEDEINRKLLWGLLAALSKSLNINDIEYEALLVCKKVKAWTMKFTYVILNRLSTLSRIEKQVIKKYKEHTKWMREAKRIYVDIYKTFSSLPVLNFDFLRPRYDRVAVLDKPAYASKNKAFSLF